ncbi:MAG: sugar ABC transporter permease [bacterium]|nr:sugar ABC transporter permease [bacterium]
MPWLITFLWFTLGPFIASIYLSFTNYRFIGLPEWVGLNNYVRLFTDDAKFIRSVINTLYYTAVHVPGIMIMAFFVAILLNQKVKGQPIYRTAFYLPSVTAGVATAYLWILLLQPNGLVNQFLGLVGIDGPNWLTSSTWAMPALILMSFWGLGTTMIIYLAALQGIPQHLYEAASVDGAGVIRKMWHVTVPMMTPAIFLTAVLQIIGSWQVFTQALIVTNGGPRDSTLFILLHLYRTGFEYFQMGYASAIAWVLFVIILVFTILQFGVARRWVYYEGSTER